ncbi:c-type cytochrome [Salegentibacter sp. BLCTC]|uniref:cbb3-type cytochrome c oxidase N-terminal domain-containing protein n=1 Tax=Salegentibacter sp. BLCTC TaxID=2697368 RepID=UPI00187B4E0B|nr:cbb3-type cytochrome c oxidase N-terminal domain-containing protein [Salegentibacter sp. BLCTC]MBE7638727.1 c-type cytochrome [Salegentibacter sp. BLCTC]
MKTNSYLRIAGFLILALVLIELTIEAETDWAFQQYPVIWGILAIVLVIAIAIEVSITALENMVFRSLKPDAQERYKNLKAENSEKQFSGIKRLYKKMLNQKPMEKEDEILLDHNYDGIKELDNDLPSWWLYGFYVSIIFAFVYMGYYHIFDGETQTEEYLAEVAQAKEEIEAYKKANPDLIDASSVELLTEASDLEAGEQIFMTSCMACHKADGGGSIGPNLTDKHWILGGGISNVFQTVSEGGRDGKGMVAWKSELSAQEIAQVSSYVISLEGTNPPDAKAPEGEVWEPETE